MIITDRDNVFSTNITKTTDELHGLHGSFLCFRCACGNDNRTDDTTTKTAWASLSLSPRHPCNGTHTVKPSPREKKTENQSFGWGFKDGSDIRRSGVSMSQSVTRPYTVLYGRRGDGSGGKQWGISRNNRTDEFRGRNRGYARADP